MFRARTRKQSKPKCSIFIVVYSRHQVPRAIDDKRSLYEFFFIKMIVALSNNKIITSRKLVFIRSYKQMCVCVCT